MLNEYMPELPEVETTKQGITPHIEGQTITTVKIRESRLRWTVPELNTILPQQQVKNVYRRGKYLLITCSNGHLIIHLGMSGSLRIVTPETVIKKHDHVDIIFANQQCLRYYDPRRFGTILWTEAPVEQHFLIKKLGVEPLKDDFTGEYLHQLAQKRRVAIKNFIMNHHIVVGVGNIYANEALFLTGIHPNQPANQINLHTYQQLVIHIKNVLTQAIRQGGTTLRDFTNSEGQPGYFQQTLQVYGREGKNCKQCGHKIEKQIIGQRASYFCPICQPFIEKT